MVGTGSFTETICNAGPTDDYELAVILHDAENAMEFLVRQCQQKDLVISHLSRTLCQELGSGWWQKYVDEVNAHKLPDFPDEKEKEKPQLKAVSKPSDIPF
jgi:hypothetical protein